MHIGINDGKCNLGAYKGNRPTIWTRQLPDRTDHMGTWWLDQANHMDVRLTDQADHVGGWLPDRVKHVDRVGIGSGYSAERVLGVARGRWIDLIRPFSIM